MRKTTLMLILIFASAYQATPLTAQSTDEPEQSIEQLQELADAGDPKAQTKLGDRYRTGDGIERDYAKAKKWYRLAAAQDYAHAQMKMGYVYFEGLGVEKSPELAFYRFEKSARNGDKGGKAWLGYLYETGKGTEKNLRLAIRWYRSAAEDGHSRAQYNLGRTLIDQGKIAEGVGWLKKASDNDFATAKEMLAEMSRSIKRIEAGANQGDAQSQALLGLMLQQGIGKDKDLTAAENWYLKAAEQGSPIAQNNLAKMYLDGEGVKRDLEMAAQWLEKAARQGVPDSQLTLGVMYQLGEGVDQDFKSAAKWYSQAADQDQSEALVLLGRLTGLGRGVKQDPERAIALYRKAAELGNANALQFMNFLKESEQLQKENAMQQKFADEVTRFEADFRQRQQKQMDLSK